MTLFIIANYNADSLFFQEMSDNLRSLEDLARLVPEDPGEAVIFQKITSLADSHLPDRWKQWKVFQFSKEELLGKEGDPQVLNKIRFVLPTVGVTQAFNKNAAHISEKGYRELKIKMLNWSFCIGLIIRPTSLAARIRGSAVQNELVMASLDALKPLLIGQKEAARQLSEGFSETEGSVAGTSCQGTHVPKKNRESRIDRLEKTTSELKTMFQSFMQSFDSSRENQRETTKHQTIPDQEEENSESDWEDFQEEEAHTFTPLLDVDLETDCILEGDTGFDFNPQTKEQEPLIPPAYRSPGNRWSKSG